jgi:ATP-dependent Lhr-like helicase
VLTWAGDRVNDTIAAWLDRRDLKADNDGVMLSVRSGDIAAVVDALFDLADGPTISASELLPNGDIPTTEKWEPLLPDLLLRRQYASRVFDIPGAQRVARDISDACGGRNAVT